MSWSLAKSAFMALCIRRAMPERALHVKNTARDAPVATPALLLPPPLLCCSSSEAAKRPITLLDGFSELLAPLEQRAALDGAPDPEQQHLQPLQLLVCGSWRLQPPPNGGYRPVSDLADHRGSDCLFCHLSVMLMLILVE
ncbi:Os03g0821350 [Oryza sativa Japonica Group]|uniref:Os03g0821350 protein n=3 Tax=Oryza sativa TaxID=4530 RepID=C7J063_ORYSJ|nr:hypothetical protein OsI_14104 [Oryza sativa Indica Group]EEE60193.1 hypothetical protein OsJ_13148 [Oryza sativa Japonica Group]KAB8094222.1 hypothetical protein EE612_021345 [Oryza sativa]BAH92417.1 Os03g0821400 [Oryza sativa Japonica Group]BAS87096.1 Os03g0821350 [Oryza sativa Japonica Group]|eukprot:NP_001173689.1 Os03g0821400 [Oryza sativa Japonica Group]